MKQDHGQMMMNYDCAQKIKCDRAQEMMNHDHAQMIMKHDCAHMVANCVIMRKL